MATTINASNGSTSGLIQTGDASGVLALQTNNGVTALTLGLYQTITPTNAILEAATITAAAPASTQNFDLLTQPVQYFTTSAANNWTINLRGNSTVAMNTLLSTGQSVTMAILTTQGATAYYNSTVQVDGTTTGVTTKWQGGAPSAGNASGIDVYTYTIIKTASATFTVLASLTQFK